MGNKYLAILTQVVRHPRHSATGVEHVLVEVERVQPMPGADCHPQIVDFSRGGCRLRWESQLQTNEPIVLRVTDTTNHLTLELPATVRWSCAVDQGSFEAGCQFDKPVDYEHLGELFLAGFLSTEEVVGH